MSDEYEVEKRAAKVVIDALIGLVPAPIRRPLERAYADLNNRRLERHLSILRSELSRQSVRVRKLELHQHSEEEFEEIAYQVLEAVMHSPTQQKIALVAETFVGLLSVEASMLSLEEKVGLLKTVEFLTCEDIAVLRKLKNASRDGVVELKRLERPVKQEEKERVQACVSRLVARGLVTAEYLPEYSLTIMVTGHELLRALGPNQRQEDSPS